MRIEPQGTEAPEDRVLAERVLPAAGYTAAKRMAMEASVPELKPRVREIVDVARDLLDEEGVDGLSMRAIAGRLGVRAPSLYKHLPDKQAILDVLIADLYREFGDHQRAAVVGLDDPVGALFAAFREWALAHPERYSLLSSGPLSPTPLVTAAALYCGDPLRWAMRDDLDGAVVSWAFVHGLLDLEIRGRFARPFDPETVWAWGIENVRHPDGSAAPPPPFDDARAVTEFRADAPGDEPLSPRAARIVAVARDLLEEEGEEGMSMRRIAARIGVRAPSLYKHVPDKQALENGIIASVLDEQAELGAVALASSRTTGEDPLYPMMAAYRRWALEHPALHRLNVRGPLDRGGLVRSAELRGSAHVLVAARGSGLSAMAVWALTHGLIDLEQRRRLPPGFSPEALHRRGVDALRPVPATVGPGSV